MLGRVKNNILNPQDAVWWSDRKWHYQYALEYELVSFLVDKQQIYLCRGGGGGGGGGGEQQTIQEVNVEMRSIR